MTKARLRLDKIPHARLPTRFGHFEVFGFENEVDGEEAVALVKGQLDGDLVPLVRIHSQCFTGDTLHSLKCDCGEQLEQALAKIEASGCGVLIYQMQEGRGIGLLNKLYAYELQDGGVDTVEANLQLGFAADQRSYGFCAEILKYFGLKAIRLMSNNPDKIQGVSSEGIEVVERIPLVVTASSLSQAYLRTKKEKLGHLLD
ncbi:MAG: GTP cyclohydrolase II [Acidobacteria bacterium]|nr:GTP cyclohydrolase II [Acidobacteriota bacterium]MCZ6768267.1 GTP cyclohydrolase II [Acidobacteriota bacterium]MCZ6876611.1 GTP cyclohydrolase II [Acidobacteriota bacterium]